MGPVQQVGHCPRRASMAVLALSKDTTHTAEHRNLAVFLHSEAQPLPGSMGLSQGLASLHCSLHLAIYITSLGSVLPPCTPSASVAPCVTCND